MACFTNSSSVNNRWLRESMAWIAGVDGCRAGWIVALAQYDSATLTVRNMQLCPRFDDVLGLQPAPDVIAVDIPIGLLDEPRPGGRDCDHQARRLLGRRASCVFSPPCRRILQATHYDQVRGHGMSRQAFGIMPKIRQVDRLMTPAWQETVYEAHPELAFLSLTGKAVQLNKKTVAGRTARLQALSKTPLATLRNVRPVFRRTLKTFKRSQVAPDDLLDACVLLWTAYRIVHNQASRVPIHTQRDARGLQMAIWF
jgi:predicted RNase H-like nuclease